MAGQLAKLLDDQTDSGDSTFAVRKAEPDTSRPSTTYCLAGRLVLSKSGWLLLEVPNSLVQGLFSAMDEAGVELPPSGEDGRLNAHISVFRPEELEQLGGASRVTERGKTFRYGLGPIRCVEPAGWSEMSRAWFVTVISPDLQELRMSYGLPARPNNGKFDFHLTFAVRRRGVLRRNVTSKQSESFMERGLAAQMAEPEWDQQRPFIGNLVANGLAAHRRAIDLANQQQQARMFAAGSDPAIARQMLSEQLNGSQPSVLKSPIDQLLLAGQLR